MNAKSGLMRWAAGCLVVFGMVTAGCLASPASTGADFGATQGGVQDMGFARELIANGQVPPAEAFVVEGMFSEHDLPLSGAPCSSLLCLRGALGRAPTVDGADSAWLQLGMSSQIVPAQFQRPSLTLVMAVDVSGSMGWSYTNGPDGPATPGALSRKLLRAIAGQLGPDDQVAIVTYGSSVWTALELTRGDDPAVGGAIDSLRENGSTNMEAGLERAYQIAQGAVGAKAQTRVMLFTDAQPNVGLTDATDFERMARAGADAGVGLTVFGLGLGMGQEVVSGISHLRGGNAFSLFTSEDVDALMEDSWPWMVSPIAYDLEVKVTPAQGFSVQDAYGIPADASGGAQSTVSTVFLSRRRGAILLRLEAGEEQDLAQLSLSADLSYKTPAGAPVTEHLSLGLDGQEVRDERGHWYAQPSVGRSIALALLVSGMREAATRYADDRPAAIAGMRDVLQRFRADATALGGEELVPEVKLAEDLLALMEKGAPQGSLYGMR